MKISTFGGASVRRVIDRSNVRVPQHAHGWPLLSLFVIGGYCTENELGQAEISGPSAVLYRAGAVHSNTIGPSGFEQIEIEFDPEWLGLLPDAPVTQWCGGEVGAAARNLAQLCISEIQENRLRSAMREFLQRAVLQSARQSPGWLPQVSRRLRADPAVRVAELARAAGRHPSWLGTAYQRVTGETLPETLARLRVERAAQLLRESELSCTEVAQEAGFCDQSHMNRTFQRLLRRTPTAVRNDRLGFRA